jgi:hypothetical protein
MNPLASDYYEDDDNHENDQDSVDTESTASSDTEFSEEDYSYDYNSNFQMNLSNNYVNKNILLIPEIYNKYFHGKTFDSDPNIDGQFLVLQTFYINNNNNNNNNDIIFEFFKYVNNLCKFYKKYYEKHICELYLPHILLRNYNNIIKHPSYLKLQIGQIYYLKGNECVCVIKTIWFKLIQRAWKKIYKIRNKIKKLRCRPDSVMYRQFCGKWPQNCSYLPSIRGMLTLF